LHLYEGNELKLVTEREWAKVHRLFYACALYSTPHYLVGSKYFKDLVEKMKVLNLQGTKTVKVLRGTNPTCLIKRVQNCCEKSDRVTLQQHEPKIMRKL